MRFGASAFRGLTLTALCAASIGLAACGSSDDSDQDASSQAADQKAVMAVADQLREAYQQKDPASICDLVDPQGLKEQFVNMKGCEHQIGQAINQAGSSITAADFNVDTVTVEDDRAVGTQTEGNGNRVFFKKVGSQWYIDVNPTGESESPSAGGAASSQ